MRMRIHGDYDDGYTGQSRIASTSYPIAEYASTEGSSIKFMYMHNVYNKIVGNQKYHDSWHLSRGSV